MKRPPCLSCGSSDTSEWACARDVEYRTSDELFHYHRCASCQVLFIDPVPLDRLGVIYPRNYYSFQPEVRSFAFALKERLDRALFRSILAAIPGDALRVLDVGGGSGAQLDSVRESDARVRRTLVVDLDRDAAAQARARGHEYFCGRIEDFASDERFDFVLLLNLIEHVESPGRVLRKLRGMLAPGGALLVKTPNTDALDARLFRHTSWAGYHCPRHWVLFTRESFGALAQASGFTVRSFAYTQGAPFWAASLICWLERRGLASVTRERPAIYHPLFGPLSLLFAAFDFLRRPFAKTSQMFFVLGPA